MKKLRQKVVVALVGGSDFPKLEEQMGGDNGKISPKISFIILLHEKFLQFDWLRAVVFQLNLKYLHVKITNLLRVVV